MSNSVESKEQVNIVFEEDCNRSTAYIDGKQRTKNAKIIPLCSYADKLMSGKEEFKDVLY